MSVQLGINTLKTFNLVHTKTLKTMILLAWFQPNLKEKESNKLTKMRLKNSSKNSRTHKIRNSKLKSQLNLEQLVQLLSQRLSEP